jgi:hypothetical protein
MTTLVIEDNSVQARQFVRWLQCGESVVEKVSPRKESTVRQRNG